MNRYIHIVLLTFFATFCPIIVAEGNNPLMAAVLNQVNKVSNKPIHKSPIEYRQAVERYIAATKACSLSHSSFGKGKILSYEIELLYLFNNYGRFSTATLLSRLRSAHQEMLKYNPDIHGEKYQRYEQICSALLLQCAQMLSDNARKQLLDALHEVDDLIVYWRYQKNHPLSYCFGKSPIKWVTGKTQEKEISSNLKRLEYKQAELYTALGKLSAHAHSFTECDTTYNDCYTWIEELFIVLSCIKIGSDRLHDGTRFDKIALQLELKIKVVGNLKYNCLRSLASVQKSNHFVRNWIAYTVALAATGYAVHYHLNHAGVMFAAYAATRQSASEYCGLLLNPLDKVYQRGKLVFSGDPKKVTTNDNQNMDVSGNNEEEGLSQVAIIVSDSIDDLSNKIEDIGKNIRANVKAEVAKCTTSLKEDGVALRGNALTRAKNATNYFGLGGNSYDIKQIETIEEDIKNNKFDSFKAFADKIELNDPVLYGMLTAVTTLFRLHGLCESLEVYTGIIDDQIIPLIKLIVILVVKLARDADDQLQKADAKMKDNELTLMFSALIPLAGTCFGVAKTYQWATARDYSPIRLALADVNSLLIESPMPLDDYDYGKLIYLVHKLRNKASMLKAALCNEFLADVTKLESKRFDVVAKRGIVENMFNRYAFLGRIAA